MPVVALNSSADTGSSTDTDTATGMNSSAGVVILLLDDIIRFALRGYVPCPTISHGLP